MADPMDAGHPVLAGHQQASPDLCAISKDPFHDVTVPIKPKASGGFLPNRPVENPCSSIFELLYEKQLYTAAQVLRVGLGRESTMLFDPFTAITVLAPTDASFAKVGVGENTQPNATWKSIAESHVLPGVITSKDIACSRREGSRILGAQTWNTIDVTLTIDATAVLRQVASRASTASVSQADVPACLSVLHVLGDVLSG